MRLARTSFLAALIGLGLVAVSAQEAAAWQCTARSRAAMGWGVSSSRSSASQRALRECAVRTPRGMMCRITRCRR
ncbi:MAG: hypothetical protein LWW93_01360 [Hyphomicrobiales bacterium]|nr:hypothetical protein [Hyphomicrobiales bacterium]